MEMVSGPRFRGRRRRRDAVARRAVGEQTNGRGCAILRRKAGLLAGPAIR